MSKPPVVQWANGTVLQFGAWDSPYYVYLDDISVVINPPVLRSVTITNGAARLTWSSVSNHVYQVQYLTKLTQNNWSNLNGGLTATNITQTATDPIGTNVSRFYRILLSQ